jgi:hypothetical protein
MKSRHWRPWGVADREEYDVTTWAEFGLIAPITFANAMVRLVILICLRTLTVLFLSRLTLTNAVDDATRISRKVCSSLKLHHHWQQTFENVQNDQIDPICTTFRTVGFFRTVLHRSICQAHMHHILILWSIDTYYNF